MIKQIIPHILCAALLYFVAPHDAPIAMFKLMDKGDYTAVHITLDAADLSNAVSLNIEEIDLEYINQYLDHHLSIILDDEVIDFELKTFDHKIDHIHLSGRIDSSISNVDEVKVQNTCMLDIEGQNNIVQLRYGDELRDFRMTKTRQEIEVEM